MLQRLRRLVPTPEDIRRSRWLTWLGPWIHHPRLWHWSRRRVALGVGLGVFFGLLVPLAQIPLSATAAVFLRANLPAAVTSTLITNPLTLGPIYYGAYRLGAWVLGETSGPVLSVAAIETAVHPPENVEGAWERTVGVGKPLALGLAMIATGMGLLAYSATHVIWRAVILRRRRRGRRLR